MAIATCLQCRKLTGDIEWHASVTHVPHVDGPFGAQEIARRNSGLRAQSDAMVNSLRPNEIDVLLRMEVSATATELDARVRERAEARIAQLKRKLGLKD